MMFLRPALLVLSLLSIASAQQTAPQPPQQKANTAPTAQTAHELGREDDPLADGAPVVTHHQITVNGKTLKYTATAGRILLKPESGPTEAAIFFTAYTIDGEDARTRPLTFVFNGGPGTATAWLHMGAHGPRKIKL
jgi:carboxypeptidase C (cathepsin A)